ncbi:MAG: hypothetical protein ACKVVT_03690 [Dehalococcoidia bacterium]
MPKLIAEDEIQEQLQVYERRLREEWEVKPAQPVTHFKRPREKTFRSMERGQVTILFGGLTRTHDYILKAATEGLGYRSQDLPVPDNRALATGKEFGNRGQCNPTYYTVGNLVQYLQTLRKAGVEEIEQRYVFVTAGACGPCRFGMYEAEYRKALIDAGFPDFRVLIFSQSGGLTSEGEDGEEAEPSGGIDFNKTFYATILRALIASDIVNTMALRIRPYETEPGATDRALDAAKEALRECFRNQRSVWMALRRVRKLFESIDVDYTRLRPKVQITGEFWAQTTEGDGSYHLRTWLEAEGAEVLTDPVGTWIDYILHSAIARQRERLGIRRGARTRIVKLWLGLRLYKSFYNFYRSAFGFRTAPLVSQKRLAAAAGDYYDTRLSGGEGHMEVGKHILSFRDRKAHMVASIKPFGCMPSTQSDGVQSKVVSDLKQSIFLPLETTGDGEVNFKSRVQMKLFEARVRAREELDEALHKHGVTVQDVREFAATRPTLRRPTQELPHTYTSVAANFVEKVAKQMPKRR